MRQIKRYENLDWFRLAAAALVVAIHTSPLASFDEGADFFLTRVLARIAVPFFLMVTGQFVAGEIQTKGPGRALRYVRKTALLYGIAILLYLPVGIYAGHYDGITALDGLRMLVFDGTFYHLWYFPACMTGVLLVCLAGRRFGGRPLFLSAVVLYVCGLAGDSYYGLTEMVPALAELYEAGFHVFSYTRNGIFMAPLFLLLGAQTAQSRLSDRRILWAGLGVSFLAMTEEAFLLRGFELQRHDSMYVLLPVVMFFLYRLLLVSGRQPEAENSRAEGAAAAVRSGRRAGYAVTVSAWVYILHPAMIVAVRGVAKVLDIQMLVENSLVHYICVLSVSAVAAGIIALLQQFLGKRRLQRRICTGQGTERNLQLRDSRFLHTSRVEQNRGHKDGNPDTGRTESLFRSSRAWLEVDREALHHNVCQLRNRLPASCRLMPAVKADAYGHGAVLVAKELQKEGVDAFCVACVAEGIRLRRQGIRGVILVLGYTHPEQFALLEKYQLTQTVIDHSYAVLLNDSGRTVHVHIGIDTGMHRIGIRSERLEQIMDIYEMEHLIVDGLFTHLCVSDTMTAQGMNYTAAQAGAFYQTVRQLEERGYPCPVVHIQASYGVLNYPQLAGDYARVGIALYGVLSTKEDTMAWNDMLKPVLSMKARIASVKMLYQGESAGYGIQYTAKQDMRIATLSVGYADGMPRALSCGAGSVLIGGKCAPVIGRICMDQMTVDISGIPDVQAGDEAVLIGRSGDLEISVCDIAKQAGTISNEILSRLGARLERVLV